MRLLLFSNSTNAGEEYMAYTLPYIDAFLPQKAKSAVFIPFAAVSISYDSYFAMVSEKLQSIGIKVESIHKASNYLETVQNADLIIIGGGNTFQLLKSLQDNNLMDAIRKKVLDGTPYISWSAGSNITCPSIKTTNDMPIVEPDGFSALNFIPFQINPHYLDHNPKKHAGETREMRIEEFIKVNKDMYVAGLREGSLFTIDEDNLELLGSKSCRIFKEGMSPKELVSNDCFSFLLQ